MDDVCSVCKEKVDVLCAMPMKAPDFWYCMECRARVVEKKDSEKTERLTPIFIQ